MVMSIGPVPSIGEVVGLAGGGIWAARISRIVSAEAWQTAESGPSTFQRLAGSSPSSHPNKHVSVWHDCGLRSGEGRIENG